MISLTKTDTTSHQAILRDAGHPKAALLIPEVRLVMAQDPRHPLGKINTRLELRTAWAEMVDSAAGPLVPAGTWAARMAPYGVAR